MASLTNGWKLFSAAALTAAMLFTAVPAKAEAIPDGGTFTVTWAQNPVSLNPGLSSGISSGIPGAQLFASPLQYDDQWNPHPYLAEKWEMAPDGLSLTLHLVKGAKFHDGTPITSEDVAFSIMAIKANHPFKAMYAPVSGVDTPDPYTAVIRLSKPHPAILLCMSPVLCPIMPKHVYGTDPNIRQNPANKAPIGSGPFKFVEWKPGDYIMLEKNKDFFIKGKPHVDRVIIKIIPDMNNRVMAVERGEVDAMPFFDSLRGSEASLRRQEPRGHQQGLRRYRLPRLGGLQHRQEAVRRRAGPSGSGLRHRPQFFRQGHHDGPCDAFRHPDHAVQPLLYEGREHV